MAVWRHIRRPTYEHLEGLKRVLHTAATLSTACGIQRGSFWYSFRAGILMRASRRCILDTSLAAGLRLTPSRLCSSYSAPMREISATAGASKYAIMAARLARCTWRCLCVAFGLQDASSLSPSASDTGFGDSLAGAFRHYCFRGCTSVNDRGGSDCTQLARLLVPIAVPNGFAIVDPAPSSTSNRCSDEGSP